MYKSEVEGGEGDENAEESLLSVSPGGNVLSLVMRDQGIMRCVCMCVYVCVCVCVCECVCLWYELLLSSDFLLPSLLIVVLNSS